MSYLILCLFWERCFSCLFFYYLVYIWCPSSSQTQTSLYLFWQSDRICATLVLRYQCEHIVQALSGACWHGNENSETAKIEKNPKLIFGTKPQDPVSTPSDPVSCGSATTQFVGCSGFFPQQTTATAPPASYSVFILESNNAFTPNSQSQKRL